MGGGHSEANATSPVLKGRWLRRTVPRAMVLVLLGCGGSALGQKKNLRARSFCASKRRERGGLDLPLEVVEAADGLGPNPAQHVVVVNELASPKAAGKPQKVLTLPSKKPSLQSPALTTTMGDRGDDHRAFLLRGPRRRRQILMKTRTWVVFLTGVVLAGCFSGVPCKTSADCRAGDGLCDLSCSSVSPASARHRRQSRRGLGRGCRRWWGREVQ